jgi:hypothetical protein
MCCSAFGTSSGYSTCNTRWGQRVHSPNPTFGGKGSSQYFDVVLSNVTTDDTPTPLYLDGGSLEFATFPNKIYTFNVKAVGIQADDKSVGKDIFASFVTDGSNVLTQLHQQAYDQYATTGFATADIALVINGTGIITIEVTGNTGATVHWMAYMWGVEMKKPS